MAACNACSTYVDENATFCPNCGTALIETDQEGGALQTTVIQNEDKLQPLDLPRAPKIRRLTAGFIDCAIVMVMVVPMYRLAAVRSSARWALVPYIIPCLYLLLRDALGGRSIGKWLTGLVTYNVRNQKPADFADSIIRNWFLTVIIIPPRIWFLNLGMILFTVMALIISLQIILGLKKRLGDGWANTQVVERWVLEQKAG